MSAQIIQIIITQTICCFFGILSFAYFITTLSNDCRKKVYSYLFYSFYCFSVAFLFLRNYYRHIGIFHPIEDYVLIFETLPVIFYACFIYNFLDDIETDKGKENKQKLYHFFKRLAIFLLIYNACYGTLLYFNFEWSTILKTIYPFMMIPVGVYAVFAYFIKLDESKKMKPIIIGSLAIAIGAGISYLPSAQHTLQPSFQIGAIIDIFVIAVAIHFYNKREKTNLIYADEKPMNTIKAKFSEEQLPLPILIVGAPQNITVNLSDKDLQFKEKFDQVIHDSGYRINANDELARMMGLGNIKNLQNRIRPSFTDKSVLQYIKERGIIEACRLLQESNLSIIEIREKVGYHRADRFNKTFYEQMKMTPEEYRTQNRTI